MFARVLALSLLLPSLAGAHENTSSLTQEGSKTCIQSNGAPNHDMGQFPNRANPNAFEPQTLKYLQLVFR